jgi:hypothetical protein
MRSFLSISDAGAGHGSGSPRVVMLEWVSLPRLVECEALHTALLFDRGPREHSAQ